MDLPGPSRHVRSKRLGAARAPRRTQPLHCVQTLHQRIAYPSIKRDDAQG
jgi:hypothetical protein